MIQEHALYGIPVDYHNFFEKNKESNLIALKYEEIGLILSNEPEINNKIIMANSQNYAYYIDSKFLFSSFQEGIDTDTIITFLNRQNWSDYDLKFSNITSVPQDRYGIKNPVPDYLIYEINDRNNPILHVLNDPNSSQIPSNFELLYISNDQTILIYKINHI
tara:strand:- start:76 stop:561 length:486 start_codon:yes stop_codon:yes gene_type:complete